MEWGNKILASRMTRFCVFTGCAACLVYFIFQIYEKWDGMGSAVAALAGRHWLIAAEAAMSACGILVETLRWSVLRRGFLNGDFRTDFSATLRAIALGNSTPGNVGEHAGRGLSYTDSGAAAIVSLLASVLQTMNIVLLGAFGAVALISGGYEVPASAARAIIVFSACCLLAAAVFSLTRGRAWFGRLRDFWSRRAALSVFASFTIGLGKTALFSSQLFLLLGVGCACTSSLYCAVLLYYLCITLTPRVNVIDVGVKGAWALAIFGSFVPSASIITATVSLWAFNIAIPSAIGYAVMAASWLKKDAMARRHSL